MSNEKNYRYYTVTGDEVIELNNAYDAIAVTRSQILDKMTNDSGAIAWTTRSGWGEYGTLVQELAFKANHTFSVPVKVVRTDWFDNQKVIIVKGRGRTSEARAFNAELAAHIKTANDVLKNNPAYQEYLISHYNVKLCTLGAPSSSRIGAVSMISTYCGTKPGDRTTLLFAIPIPREKNDKQPEVPANFTEVTYGQFYDMSNAKGD